MLIYSHQTHALLRLRLAEKDHLRVFRFVLDCLNFMHTRAFGPM